MDGPPPLEKIPSLGRCQSEAPPLTEAKQLPSPRTSLAGFKKGFLNSSHVAKGSSIENPIEVTPVSNPNPDRLSQDVQKALKSSSFFVESEKLLETIGKSPKLMEALWDTEFHHILAVIKENPERGRQKLIGNPRYRELYLEYARVLGEEAAVDGSFAGSPSPLVTDAHAGDMDKLIQLIRERGMVDPREIEHRHPELKHKMKELLSSGLLKLERM